MDKKWPFGFFVYSSVGDNEDTAQPEEEAVEEVLEEDMPDEVVEVEVGVEAETETDAEVEEDAGEDVFDEDEDADLPDLEEELEIALEKNHQQEVKKQRLVTGISAGVALLGAVGLATGLAIRSHFKKK